MVAVQMRTQLATCMLLVLTLAGPAHAQTYRVTVERVADNLYRDRTTQNVIQTERCFVFAYFEDAILEWHGQYGDNWLIFPRGVRCRVIASFGTRSGPYGFVSPGAAMGEGLREYHREREEQRRYEEQLALQREELALQRAELERRGATSVATIPPAIPNVTVLGAQFISEKLNARKVNNGVYRDAFKPGTRWMGVYAQVVGLLQNDQIDVTLVGPDNTILHGAQLVLPAKDAGNTIVWTAKQRARRASWPLGTYVGRFRVTRNGNEILEFSKEIALK